MANAQESESSWAAIAHKPNGQQVPSGATDCCKDCTGAGREASVDNDPATCTWQLIWAGLAKQVVRVQSMSLSNITAQPYGHSTTPMLNTETIFKHTYIWGIPPRGIKEAHAMSHASTCASTVGSIGEPRVSAIPWQTPMPGHS